MDQTFETLLHASGEFLFQVGDEDALLRTRSEIEQTTRNAAAPGVIGYIVTDDVLHGVSSFWSFFWLASQR